MITCPRCQKRTNMVLSCPFCLFRFESDPSDQSIPNIEINLQDGKGVGLNGRDFDGNPLPPTKGPHA